MDRVADLRDAFSECPTYERWDDDGAWEEVVILEMIRNFGVSSRDVVAKLKRLLRREHDDDDTVSYFLEKLTDDQKRTVCDAIEAIAQGRVEGILIEKLEGARFSYRATTGDIRFTFTFHPPPATAGRSSSEPHLFMVDVVARRA